MNVDQKIENLRARLARAKRDRIGGGTFVQWDELERMLERIDHAEGNYDLSHIEREYHARAEADTLPPTAMLDDDPETQPTGLTLEVPIPAGTKCTFSLDGGHTWSDVPSDDGGLDP